MLRGNWNGQILGSGSQKRLLRPLVGGETRQTELRVLALFCSAEEETVRFVSGRLSKSIRLIR